MAARRPFAAAADLLAAADEVWNGLGRADWLEAFAAHPRIGELAALRARERSEQAGAAAADGATLTELAAGNALYERRFGHVFLICASGRSAVEMLAALRVRLANDAPTELALAAEEQRKITVLRLERLLREPELRSP